MCSCTGIGFGGVCRCGDETLELERKQNDRRAERLNENITDAQKALANVYQAFKACPPLCLKTGGWEEPRAVYDARDIFTKEVVADAREMKRVVLAAIRHIEEYFKKNGLNIEDFGDLAEDRRAASDLERQAMEFEHSARMLRQRIEASRKE